MAGRGHRQFSQSGQVRSKRVALLSGAALAALAIGLLGAQSGARADIGLVKGGRGTAYVTILGGYQHRDGAAAIAPSAPGGVNLLPGGVDAEGQAIVTPDLVSTKTKVRQGSRSAEAEGSATPNSTSSNANVEQSLDGQRGEANASSGDTGDRVSTDSNTQTSAGNQRSSASTSTDQNGDTLSAEGSSQASAGDNRARAIGSAAGTFDGSTQAAGSSQAQSATEDARAEANTDSTPGIPSTVNGFELVEANNIGFSQTATDIDNPASVNSSAATSDGNASASTVAEGMADSPPNQAASTAETSTTVTGAGESDTNTGATAAAGGATAITGTSSSVPGAEGLSTSVITGIPGATNASSQASNIAGGSNDSLAASQVFVSGGASQSNSAVQNLINGDFGQARAVALSSPQILRAETIAQLLPGAGVQSNTIFDRETHTPLVAFDTTSGPVMTDLMTQNLEADDGAFGGGSLGYVFMAPVLGLIDRAEGYVTRARNEDDKREQSFVFEGVSADGQALAAAFSTYGLNIQTREVLTQTELGMRFKSDGLAHGPVPLIVSVEPFYQRYEHEARYGVENLAQFDGTVDADYWGGQLALETEIPLLGEAISWVGRASAGVYWMDADGRFSNSLTGKTLSPGEEETGYRLGAETGLRVFVTEHAYLTATGAVDHLSEAPFVVFRDGVEGAPSYVGMDELTRYRANLRLTMSTQLHRAEPVY